jgi:hypothetical protein
MGGATTAGGQPFHRRNKLVTAGGNHQYRQDRHHQRQRFVIMARLSCFE